METTARNRTIGGIVIGAIILILLLVLFSCTVNSDPESSPKKDPTTGESSLPSDQDTLEPEDKPSESESDDAEADEDDIVPAANTGVTFIPAGNVPSGSTPTCELDKSACGPNRPPGAGVDICEVRPDLDQCQPPPTTPPGDGEPTTPPDEGDDSPGGPICDILPDLPICDDDDEPGPGEPGEPGEPDTTDPDPVNVTDCNVLTNTSAKVHWSKAHDKSGISHYTVTSRPTAGDARETEENSATFGGLDAGRTYTFSVTATDKAGNESDDGNELDCVMDVTPPAVPTAVTVESIEPTDSTLAVSWDDSFDNSDGVGDVTYNLYRDGKFLTAVNDTEYEDSGLKAGSKYTYTVTAVDGAGNESDPSAEATGETTKVAPTVPQNVKVENANALGFDVSWKGSTDQDHVTTDNEIVYIVRVQGGLLCLPTTTDGGASSARINCLLGQDSTVTVTAEDTDGHQSAPSDPASDPNARRQVEDPALRSNTPGKDKSDAPADKPGLPKAPVEVPSDEPTEEKSPLLPPLGDVLGGDKDSEEPVKPEPSESESPAERPTTDEPADEKDAPAEEKDEDEGGLLGGLVGSLTSAVAAVF